MTITIRVKSEQWPIAGSFVIARGAKTEAEVVVVEIELDGKVGWGEAVPYARYGETVGGVIDQINGLDLASDDRQVLYDLLPAGAARNAVDCALWDLEAKRTGQSAAIRCGTMIVRPLETAFTLSLGTPEDMGNAARRAGNRPLLKVKLGGDGDVARLRAVRAGAPGSRIIIDANEAWTPDNIHTNLRACAEIGVSLIEQPLPEGDDEILREIPHVAPICADESVHTSADLPALKGKYDAVNVKLDKAGGFTEALKLVHAARDEGYLVMVGCMLGTSLAMAPAVLLGQYANIVDLDGPLLLQRDRRPGLTYVGSLVEPPSAGLWG